MKKSRMFAMVGALALVGASCAFAGAGAIRKIPETYLTMAVGSSGGGWYIMGAGLNQGWEAPTLPRGGGG